MGNIDLPIGWNTYKTNIDGIELEWSDIDRMAAYSYFQVSEIRGDPRGWTNPKDSNSFTLQTFYENHQRSRSKDWFRTKGLLDGFIPNSMLDIGSGYGFNALMWAKTNPDMTIDLIDGDDKLDSNLKHHDIMNSVLIDDYPTYNDWDIITDAINDNDIKNTINLLDVNEFTVEDNHYDFITSQWSCGWHYSVDHYLDVIDNSLMPGGYLILDIADKKECDKITERLGVNPNYNIDQWMDLNRHRYVWKR